ncbi:hypothetical protein G6F23_014604 [Rhizopus arrhizus]|nr:hypothetical protein G6F23_014604 [Rhizopus arrhizus]
MAEHDPRPDEDGTRHQRAPLQGQRHGADHLCRAAGAGPLVQAAGPHAVRAGAPRGAAARRQRGRRGDRDRDLLVVGQQRVFPGGTARAGRLVPRIRRADRARAPAAH